MFQIVTSSLRFASLSWSSSLFTLFSLYWACWIIYTRYFHPLSKYPGPFLASVSRLWITLQVAGGKAEESQRRLHAQLGPIIRIAPNEVAIADPDSIKTIYSHNSKFTKTDFYLPWRPAWAKYPDNFTCLDEQVHTNRRKIVNSLYSMSSIVKAEDGIDVCIDMFMAQMAGFADSGDVLDAAQWVQWYAFDVIGQLFFSRMFGFMREKSDHRNYIKSLDTLLPVLAVVSTLPTYLRTLCLVGGAMIPKVLAALSAIKDIEVAAESCVAERQSLLDSGSHTESKDILSSLMDISSNKNDKIDFGLTEVKVEVYVALFAGSDTTAAAISAILYHLVKTPAAYRKLKDEISQAFGDGRLSRPHVKYNEAAKLPYLDACCKEGLRLHPSVGFTMPRTVPPEGRYIAGEWFPGGSRVGINAAVVHRNKSIFGDDADQYNPDRWLQDDAENMDRYMFHFGAGSRTCIGKNISLCEMYKLIPRLLGEFDLEAAGGDWKTHNFWFHKPSEIYIRASRAKGM